MHVLVAGEVDGLTSVLLEQEMDTAWARTPASVVVDLGGVTFLTVSSLAVLFRARNEAVTRGVAFDVVALPAHVARFLTRMDLQLGHTAR